MTRGHRRGRNPISIAALFVCGLGGFGIAGVGLAGCDAIQSIPAGSNSVLGGFQLPTPQEAADMATDEYNADRRFRGIQLISYAPWGGDDVYLRMYLDRLSDEDAGVRWAATRAIARHGLPEHVPLLIERLDDERVDVRIEAARALQRIHNPEAVPALVAAINPEVESDPRVRAEAAHALGQYPEPLVVQALVGALSDRQLTVNTSALKALRVLTGQDFGFDTAAWVTWVEGAPDPFAAQQPYTYPVFNRDKRLVEWLPLVPPPPNESASTPVGLPPMSGG